MTQNFRQYLPVLFIPMELTEFCHFVDKYKKKFVQIIPVSPGFVAMCALKNNYYGICWVDLYISQRRTASWLMCGISPLIFGSWPDSHSTHYQFEVILLTLPRAFWFSIHLSKKNRVHTLCGKASLYKLLQHFKMMLLALFLLFLFKLTSVCFALPNDLRRFYLGIFDDFFQAVFTSMFTIYNQQHTSD